MNARALIFTGEGKGKTTAALGMVMRAAGHGQRALVVQFIKSNAETGELLACARLPGIEIVQMGLGFVPKESSPEFASHREAGQKALEFSRRSVASGDYDLIVLDEICVAIARNLIEEESALGLLTDPARTACIVLTGRGATPRLIEHADTVTEARCVKHGFSQGIKSQKGVEW